MKPLNISEVRKFLKENRLATIEAVTNSKEFGAVLRNPERNAALIPLPLTLCEVGSRVIPSNFFYKEKQPFGSVDRCLTSLNQHGVEVVPSADMSVLRGGFDLIEELQRLRSTLAMQHLRVSL